MQKKKNVPAFLRNTYQMLEREELNAVVAWADVGNGFVIKDLERFSLDILPQYFKHKKYTSFVRQLNMYGFHKQRHSHSYHYFAHPHFCKGEMQAHDQKELLATIKRKPEKKKKNQQPQHLDELQQFEGVQEQQSERSVSLNFEDEKSREGQYHQQETERLLKVSGQIEESWSQPSQQQLQAVTEQVIRQNQIICSLHSLLRSELLDTKRRTIYRLTVERQGSDEQQRLLKLASLLLESAEAVQRIFDQKDQIFQ